MVWDTFVNVPAAFPDWHDAIMCAIHAIFVFVFEKTKRLFEKYVIRYEYFQEGTYILFSFKLHACPLLAHTPWLLSHGWNPGLLFPFKQSATLLFVALLQYMYILSCTLSLAHSYFPAAGTSLFHSRVPMTLPFFGYSTKFMHTLSLARARAVSRAHFLLPSHCTRVQMHIFRIYIHTYLSLSFFLSLSSHRTILYNIYTYPLSRAHSFSRSVSFSPFLCLSLFASHCTIYTWIWAHRPSIKGSKLLFPVIKAIKIKIIPSLPRALFLAPISLSFRRHRKKRGIFFPPDFWKKGISQRRRDEAFVRFLHILVTSPSLFLFWHLFTPLRSFCIFWLCNFCTNKHVKCTYISSCVCVCVRVPVMWVYDFCKEK